MAIAVPVDTLELAPGSIVSIPNFSWQDFETILSELGDRRRLRLTYYNGTLELMSPRALHERPHRIIADIVKTLLDAADRDWEDFGSTTFKRPELAGVEPDTCFYIANAARVRGCTEMDLAVYPPPDLAIECDVTSQTTLEVYRVLEVPEVWIYSKEQLTIYLLNAEGAYDLSASSPTFPELSPTELIPELVQQAIAEGTRTMLRQLREKNSNNDNE